MNIERFDNYFGEVCKKDFIEKYNLKQEHLSILKYEIGLLKSIFKEKFPNIDLDNMDISNINDILFKIKDFFEDILIDINLYNNDIYKFLSIFNRNNSLLLDILDINYEFDIYSIVEVVQNHITNILNKNFNKFPEFKVLETKGYVFDFKLPNKKYVLPIYKFLLNGKKIEGDYDVKNIDHIYKTSKGYYFLANKGDKYILYKLVEKEINNTSYLIMEKVSEALYQFVIKENKKLYMIISNNYLLYLSNDGLEEYEIICERNELIDYKKVIKSIKKVRNISVENDFINDKVIFNNSLVFELSDNYDKNGEFFEIDEVDKKNKLIFIKKFK